MAGSVAIAVTGADGFIGCHVTHALRARGFAVRGLLGPASLSGPCKELDFEFFTHADIVDADALDAVLAGTSAVVHAAGPPSVAESFTQPGEYMRVHALGTTAVLEACVRAGVHRIVHISSAEVYGTRVLPLVSELEPLNAVSPYGAAKIAAEQMVRAFATAGKLEAIVLRPFSVYGPRTTARNVVSDVLAQAAPRATIRVRDPRPVRDFCFVDDVAEAVVAACRASIDGFAALNVGTGVGTSVAALVRLCAELTGASGLDAPREEQTTGNRVDRLVASTELARSVLGWVSSTSLREGLRHTVAGLATS